MIITIIKWILAVFYPGHRIETTYDPNRPVTELEETLKLNEELKQEINRLNTGSKAK